MEPMEITLVILGAVVFAASFIIPEMKNSDFDERTIDKEEIRKAIEGEVIQAKEKLEGVVEETVEYAVEKTERSLDRLSNEKIMAVNEYSDTVLEEISKNHKEVMFLYDMLSDKQIDLKNTVRKAEQTSKDTKEAVVAVKESISAAKEAGVSLTSEDEYGTFFVEGISAKEIETKNPKIVRAEKPKEAKPKEAKPKEVGISFEQGEEVGKNKNEKILSLHKNGKSNVAIAKELGLGVGEVKLVIDLFEGVNE